MPFLFFRNTLSSFSFPYFGATRPLHIEGLLRLVLLDSVGSFAVIIVGHVQYLFSRATHIGYRQKLLDMVFAFRVVAWLRTDGVHPDTYSVRKTYRI